MSKDFKAPLFEDLTPGAKPRPKQATPQAAGAAAQTFTPVDFEANKNALSGLGQKNIKDVKFEAGRFMEEGTLLTNVEEYSKKVRESADLYAKTTREVASIIRSEVETELAETKIATQKSEETAALLIKEAEDARDEIRRQASERGYVEGLAQGRKAAQDANEILSTKVLTILKQIENLRTEMYRENENTLAQLALVSAEKLVHKRLSSDRDFVLNTIQSSIKQMEGLDKIKIRINPVEFTFLKEHQKELEAYVDEEQSISFKSDPAIAPATALIETDLAQVSLNLKDQFTMIQDQLHDCFDERRRAFKTTEVEIPQFESEPEASAEATSPSDQSSGQVQPDSP